MPVVPVKIYNEYRIGEGFDDRREPLARYIYPRLSRGRKQIVKRKYTERVTESMRKHGDNNLSERNNGFQLEI